MNGASRKGIRGELTDRFVSAIQQLNRLMHNGRIDELRKLDLNPHQANTLLLLYHHGPSRMSSLASFLGSKLPHMSIIVDHLVSKGYLQRGADPADRRVVICDFTEAGRKAAEKIILHTRMRANIVAKKWDFEKLESVVETLESLWGTDDGVPASVVSDQPRRKGRFAE